MALNSASSPRLSVSSGDPSPSTPSRLSPPPIHDVQEDNETCSSSELTEQQLRQIYDDEEIERFLHLFSSYVTEIRLPSSSTESLNIPIVTGEEAARPHKPNREDSDPSRPPPLPLRQGQKRSPSETIANEYLRPLLPPVPLPTPPFTFKRFQLTSQRLYLATVPNYTAFALNMVRLALWKDHTRSTRFCLLYWILWYYDYLLPALLCRIIFGLLRRRIFPYPTAKELESRRQDTARADELGNEIQRRLADSTVGVGDVWGLFRTYRRIKKKQAAFIAKSAANQTISDESQAVSGSPLVGDENPTGLEESQSSKEDQDLKRDILHAMNEIADIHERVKNIFLWRRPSASRIYTIALVILLAAVVVLPARYLAKLTYLVTGIAFWHLVPVIAALSPSDRARLPPAFDNVPTDADYAMDLISQRVANGLDVRPKSRARPPNPSPSPTNASTSNLPVSSHVFEQEATPRSKDGLNWQKMGTHVARGKAWVEDGKRLLSTGHLALPSERDASSLRSRHPPTQVASNPVPGETVTHTYPAQHTSGPGLITLTNMTFFFTPLASLKAKLQIPLDQVAGVKKTGLVKGLSLTWTTNDDGTSEKQEKFLWTAERDDLFARLLGSSGKGRQWMRI
ncbi:hypothetical protein CONPUDRAFT_141148 [Coniophora puteana RWD-64-598 SS2]|uniref:Uncharacterized protein n=1 Tax=Coniophora puteana (strain RWD-64-598) TaxID=741705 RepID=A0A5M3N6A3_CONPW|nr:uncharacterized protein CONPUDRAFT_141148 [Coniophora puteana RWD-64-598 SS2]EIW86737.1 hypothetical protein CONPUDRAFT_141148 [Coniophora puteana RWD-64-598 SS2]